MLRIDSINNSPAIEYREIRGHPVPFTTTIQRRQLLPDGSEFSDGSSKWQTITIRNVLAQLQLEGPVARWLRELGVNVSTLIRLHPNEPAYLPLRGDAPTPSTTGG